MDQSSIRKIDSNFKFLPLETVRAFDFLSAKDWIKEQEWYLAGGTALALQVGSRKSYDLDFFTQKRDFDNNEVLSELLKVKQWNVTIDRKNTIYGDLFGCKTSFITYPFFIPKQEPIWYKSIKILAPLDIAVMKIIAVSQRGRKRDFFDLYWCAQNVESLQDIVRRLKVQYPTVVHDYHHILKALIYFADAENDPEPEIFFESSWPIIKEFFKKEVPPIAKKIMGLG